jgi:uncharacterized protein
MKLLKSVESACPRWIEILQIQSETREKIRKKVWMQVEVALDTLSEAYSWDEVYIFGSLIREGKFSSKSDVDIAIKGLNKFQHFSFVGDFSLLLGRDVDVIRLEDCHFSNSITSGGIKWSSKKGSPSS